MIHLEVRRKMVEAAQKGIKVKDICASYSVGKTAVYNLLKQERECGHIEPRTHLCGRKSLLNEEDLVTIENLIVTQKDITAAEIRERLELPVCESSVCKIVRNKLGYRYKKRQYMPASKNEQT